MKIGGSTGFFEIFALRFSRFLPDPRQNARKNNKKAKNANFWGAAKPLKIGGSYLRGGASRPTSAETISRGLCGASRRGALWSYTLGSSLELHAGASRRGAPCSFPPGSSLEPPAGELPGASRRGALWSFPPGSSLELPAGELPGASCRGAPWSFPPGSSLEPPAGELSGASRRGAPWSYQLCGTSAGRIVVLRMNECGGYSSMELLRC